MFVSSPVCALHVDLTLGARCSLHFHGDAVVGLEGVVEVAITAVHSVVTDDGDLWLSNQLGSSGGNGDQAGEENL